jgi:hypothetical protein
LLHIPYSLPIATTPMIAATDAEYEISSKHLNLQISAGPQGALAA